MIWSDKAIDYKAGFTVQPDGKATPNKIGCYVKTIEELEEIMRSQGRLTE